MFNFSKTRKAFARKEEGNIAIMGAITAAVLVGSLALAVDISNGVKTQTRLHDASDAVALMLAKSDLNTQSDMMAAAQAMLDKSYSTNGANRLQVVSIDKVGDEVTVQLTDNVDTYFAPALGVTDMDIGVRSSAIYAQKTMDIALVLDTTQSMEGVKMASLKAAATDMINTIEGYESDNVRVSVVPFSNYVNVGLSRRNAPWLDVEADSSTTQNVCRQVRDVTSTSNCRRIQSTCERDGDMVPCSYQRCDRTYGPERQVCGPRTTRKTWNGCVGSRDVPWNTRADYRGRKVPGLSNARCGEELRPLTKNMSEVKSTINAMTAGGNTYMPSGLLWGWRTLSSDMPLRNTAPADVERVMIVMTDGQNSRAKNGKRHEQRGQNRKADDTTRRLCDAVKNEDITVYTIAYDVSDTGTRQLLNRCATSASNYFDARNASDLNAAFREIGATLNELRITA